MPFATLNEAVLSAQCFGAARGIPRHQRSVEPLPQLCYRDSGLMKTDRQLGSRTQHSGKPALGLQRALRRASVPQPPTLTAFLIANLELESNSTHRKHSPLKIPNRKSSRVFDSNSALNFSQIVTHHSSVVTAFLIYGSAIKTPANPQGFNDVQFLIGGKTGASRSFAAYVFDHNSLCRWSAPVRHLNSPPPCVVGAGSSSNWGNHFKLHSNERI